MSIEAINEALEILRIEQNNMGPVREWLDAEERAHWDRISKCMDGLEKLKQQEPVAECIGQVRNAIYQVRTLQHDIPQGALLYLHPALPQPASEPDGFKLVPVEPTPEMLDAAYKLSDVFSSLGDEYRAMLSAAPVPPADDRISQRLEKAERALLRAGFTMKEGAEEWKPPLGPSPSPLLDRIAELERQRDEVLAELQSFGHKSGCRKNAFSDTCTCGVDAAIASMKGSFGVAVSIDSREVADAKNSEARARLEAVSAMQKGGN